jgi:hypothetical protein
MALSKKVFALGLISSAALATVVSLSFGSDRGSGGGNSASAPFPRVAGISRSSRGTRIRYLQARGTVQPGQDNGFSLKCPKSAPNAVSGYFYPARKEALGKLVLSTSSPFGSSNRNWDIGVADLGTEPEDFVVGVVCVR